MHTLRCPCCEVLTEADWPESVPRSPFGPSVQARIGPLSGAYRLSKRNIATLLWDAFGLDLTPGVTQGPERSRLRGDRFSQTETGATGRGLGTGL